MVVWWCGCGCGVTITIYNVVIMLDKWIKWYCGGINTMSIVVILSINENL